MAPEIGVTILVSSNGTFRKEGGRGEAETKTTTMNVRRRSDEYGEAWLRRFGTRASSVVSDVLNHRSVTDRGLLLNIYTPEVGMVSVPLYVLVEDANWCNGLSPNERGECEVLPATYLSSVIYDALQNMAGSES